MKWKTKSPSQDYNTCRYNVGKQKVCLVLWCSLCMWSNFLNSRLQRRLVTRHQNIQCKNEVEPEWNSMQGKGRQVMCYDAWPTSSALDLVKPSAQLSPEQNKDCAVHPLNPAINPQCMCRELHFASAAKYFTWAGPKLEGSFPPSFHHQTLRYCCLCQYIHLQDNHYHHPRTSPNSTLASTSLTQVLTTSNSLVRTLKHLIMVSFLTSCDPPNSC